MKYERELYGILYDLGIIKPYMGCRYIIYSIQELDNDEDDIIYVTKSLYIDAARFFHTNIGCVERDIRRVIEKIWSCKDNKDLIKKVFGYRHIYNKPTNAQFLWMLYEYIKYNLNSAERLLEDDDC